MVKIPRLVNCSFDAFSLMRPLGRATRAIFWRRSHRLRTDGDRLLRLIWPRPDKTEILASERRVIMPTTLGNTITSGRSIRTGLTLSLALTSLVAVSIPSRAHDSGAVAAGVIGGLALGALAGAAAAGAAPPQPRAKYVPVPVYVQPPPHSPRQCWYEGREEYDGYDYIMRKVKVCH